MKRFGLILTIIFLFVVSPYVAFMQGVSYVNVSGPAGGYLAAPAADGLVSTSHFWSKFVQIFSTVLTGFSGMFSGSLIAAVIALALVVEMMTLYPAVNLQLKQKKIHLFHKKLVDRFHRGELTMSAGKRELDVLYSVNERIHKRGAMLFTSQMLVFLVVFAGLTLMSQAPMFLSGTFNSFNFALVSAPVGFSLPLLASLVYLLHSFVKIHLRQREDYIDARQVYTAVAVSLLFSVMIYYFASTLAILLTVFFLAQITFATMRYLIVEENSKEWGKYVQKELIKMLRTARLHKSKMERWSRIFHHLPVVRCFNSHLLEEAMSMSLAVVLFANAMMLI